MTSKLVVYVAKTVTESACLGHVINKHVQLVKQNFFNAALEILIKLWAPCVLYIRTGVSLLSRERFLYI